MTKTDVLILGAGAAGLMAALRAGQRGKRVILLDHADQVGSKILISGGGRCNFTNRAAAPDRYLSNNPSFCISALKGYTPAAFLALVEKHKIAYHEKTLGQMFCDDSARDIVAMLLEECATAHVDIKLNQHIRSVRKTDAFQVQTESDVFEAPVLILATGGLSIPKMGATDFTHRIARQLNLPVTETRPALVPLTFEGDQQDFMRALSGLALEVSVRCGKHAFRESMLFTHRGLSGPAFLQISSFWRDGEPLHLDLLPDLDTEAFLLARKAARLKAELKTILGEVLPQRLAQALCAPPPFPHMPHIPKVPIGTLPDKTLRAFAAFLKSWTLTPAGTEGYAKAEVTLGGVDTAHWKL